ncbi:MAG: hypothetical protein LC674_03345, partial [Actinobacteria bacterium]|nr:hypothetical protein [Actinomycetota bacterium]
DGWAPGINELTGRQKRRRVILRKCLSTEDISFSYEKDKQTAATVTWTLHRVDDVTTPFKMVDEF